MAAASGRAPLDPYFTLLKPRGKLVSVSLTDAPCTLHPAPGALHPARLRCAHQVSLPDKEERSQLYLHSAVPTERALVGSYLGPLGDYEEMLNFAVEHNVRPQVEVMPVERINEAVARVRAGDARYRVVLEMPS